jgi:hypothetical protein
MSSANAAKTVPTRDMSHVWAGRKAAAARARAEKARADLEAQGWLIVAPDEIGPPIADDPALVDAWGAGYGAGWRQGYADGSSR